MRYKCRGFFLLVDFWKGTENFPSTWYRLIAINFSMPEKLSRISLARLPLMRTQADWDACSRLMRISRCLLELHNLKPCNVFLIYSLKPARSSLLTTKTPQEFCCEKFLLIIEIKKIIILFLAAFFYVGSSKNPGNNGFRVRDERGT